MRLRGYPAFARTVWLFSLLALPFCFDRKPARAEAEPEISVKPSGDPREALGTAGVSSFTKGALSNIVIRGYQRENLFVTFDGAPYFGATPFRVDAPPFLLQNSDLGQIVVTKGPYNLAYPGGAGGSVEVLSPDNPRRGAVRSSFSYGSYDGVDGRAVVSVGNGQADLTAGYRGRYSGVPEAGDGVPFTGTPHPASNNNYRPGSEDLAMYRIDSFWLKAGVNPTTNSRVELSYGFLQGTDIKVPTLTFDVGDEQIHRLNGRGVVRQITPLVREISLQGWWSRARTMLDDSLRETSDPSNVSLPYRLLLNRPYAMSSRFEVDALGSRIAASFALEPGLLKSGLDFYQRSWSGSYSSMLNAGGWQYLDDKVLLPDVTTRNVGLFASYETPLTDTVRAVVATRGDISRVDADGLTPELIRFYSAYFPGQAIPGGRDFADWSANAQLFWKLLPELELFLKGGRASRLPDAHELYVRQARTGSNLVGNPFLKQTVVKQVDIGASWEAGGHRATFSAFYSEADDFILPVRRALFATLPDSLPPSPARSTANLDAAIWGVELDGTVQLPVNLRVLGMVSYSEGRNRASGQPLAEIPPLRGRLALQYDDRTFFGGVSQTLVARQNRFDPTLNETSMPGYGVTDLSMGGRYKGFVVSVMLNNLFDIRYVQPLSYQRDPISPAVRIPENGRNFLLTASYRF